MQTPFLGSAYVSRSNNLAIQQCINLYPEIVETKSGKSVGAFYMAPGLDLLATVGGGPIRGAHVFAGLLYVVSGSGIYSINAAYMTTFIGTIGSTGSPVSMTDNGTQMAIFDGISIYVVSGGVLSTPPLPFGGPGTGVCIDGFGLTNVLGTNTFYQSNLLDFTTWNALNFSSADADSDNIVAMASHHRELWILKQFHTEIWVDAGSANFAFARLQGVYLEIGCAAAASVTIGGESIYWLTQNAEGQCIIMRFQGYSPKRISTHAIEFAIGQYASISDCISYAYQQEGHLFIVFTFPTGNQTWVYDVTASDLSGTPMWHQRAAFSNGIFSRHWGNAYATFNGRNIVGDYQSGNIYAFNLNTLTDNGMQRKWLRSWRALQKPKETPTTFSSLRIDMQTGIGVPPGTNPQLMLRWSDDGGFNWSNYRLQPAGKPGKTAQRVKFNRLGSTRNNAGLDRNFELSSTDQFGVALIGAELDAA